MYKFIICPDILLDLLLTPGWNEDNHNLEERTKNCENLKDLIDESKINIYLPPGIFQIIKANLEEQYSDSDRIGQEVRNLLNMVTTDLKVSQDQIYEESTNLRFPKNKNYSEEILLISAMKIQAYAIIASLETIQMAREIQNLNQDYFRDYNIPLLNLNSFLSSWSKGKEIFEDNENESIFVYTPGKRITKLPIGATSIDFAYKIHTDLGNRCKKVLVNEVEYSLTEPLQNGDVVEIVKGENGDIVEILKIENLKKIIWNDYCKTSAAKKGLKRCLRTKLQREGWKIINKYFSRKYKRQIKKIANQLFYQSDNEIAFKLGQGTLKIEELREIIEKKLLSEDEEKRHCLILPKDSLLKGNGNREFEISTCCHPIPGQRIIGISSSLSRPIKVHHKDCLKIQGLKNNQLIGIDWNCNQAKVCLKLRLINKSNTLIPILKQLEDKWKIEHNIHSVTPGKDSLSCVLIEMILTSNHYLNEIIDKLRKMPRVQEVRVKKIHPFRNH